LVWLEDGAWRAERSPANAPCSARDAINIHAGSTFTPVRDAVHACTPACSAVAAGAAGAKPTGSAAGATAAVCHEDDVRLRERTAANLGAAAATTTSSAATAVGGPALAGKTG